MTNFIKTNFSDKKASYEVSLILAENEKGFRDGETVKKCAMFYLFAVMLLCVAHELMYKKLARGPRYC